MPWGISESGYNARDKEMNYQYRAFGVPGLGLKRGLAGDLVVAPYASAMALMLEPQAACRNLQRLAAEGQLGTCGFYEAIDYTPSRQIPTGDGVKARRATADGVAVRQFMAHHQGMSLLAFASVLLGQPMQRRFLADPANNRRRLSARRRGRQHPGGSSRSGGLHSGCLRSQQQRSGGSSAFQRSLPRLHLGCRRGLEPMA